jgi:hypothetical protein
MNQIGAHSEKGSTMFAVSAEDAYAAYLAAGGPARHAYDSARHAALNAYRTANDSAWAAYYPAKERAQNPQEAQAAWNACADACISAFDSYTSELARAFEALTQS